MPGRAWGGTCMGLVGSNTSITPVMTGRRHSVILNHAVVAACRAFVLQQ